MRNNTLLAFLFRGDGGRRSILVQTKGLSLSKIKGFAMVCGSLGNVSGHSSKVSAVANQALNKQVFFLLGLCQTGVEFFDRGSVQIPTDWKRLVSISYLRDTMKTIRTTYVIVGST